MKLANGLSIVRAPSDDPKAAAFTVTVDDLPTYLRAIGQDQLAEWAEAQTEGREWPDGPLVGDF